MTIDMILYMILYICCKTLISDQTMRIENDDPYLNITLQLTLDERLVNNSSDGSCSNSNSSDSNKSSNSSSRRYVLTAVVQHHGLRATGGNDS